MTDAEIHNIYLHMSGKAEGIAEATGTADFPVLFARAILEFNRMEREAEKQEPVMWAMPDGKTVDKWGLQFYGGQTGTPLYTHPPKREPSNGERLELIGHADLTINNIHIFNGYGEDVPDGRVPIYAGYKKENT